MSLATWNVRGCSDEVKREQIVADSKKLSIDILALQETKCPKGMETIIDKHRFILLPSDVRHYGLGFVISPRLANQLVSHSKISDRVAEARFNIGNKNLTVINVYGPTSIVSAADPTTRERTFEAIEQIMANRSRDTIVILGDFNSKVGRGNDLCQGTWAKGTRNENGEHLVNFCLENNLFLANTAFKHPMRRITTWQGKWTNAQGKVVPIYNQIDFIIVPCGLKSSLTNCRSYSGTLATSDHKLVIARLKWRKLQFMQASRNQPEPRPDSRTLCEQLTIRTNYQTAVCVGLTTINSTDLVQRLENIRTVIWNAAKTTVPCKRYGRRSPTFCPVIQSLSERQKGIRLQLENAQLDESKRSALKATRSVILHEIRRINRRKKDLELDKRLESVERAPIGSKMFFALKELNHQPYTPPTIENDRKELVDNDTDKVRIVKEFFAGKYRGQKLSQTTIRQGPIHRPVTSLEVTQAAKQLKNGKAAGPDKIQGELIKYGPIQLHEEIAALINDIVFEGKSLDLGKGVLVLLQKPNKPKGPLANLRPIVLLNTIRKIISLIVLNRIGPAVRSYIAKSQSAYTRERSTSDIVWAHKWLVARIRKYQEIYYVLGLDMTSAFDTVDRALLLEVLADIIPLDELKLIRLLIEDTSLIVKFGKIEDCLLTFMGSPQGDALSPLLFIIYLEACLRKLRPRLPIHSIQPPEMEYADDLDLLFYLLMAAKSAEPIAVGNMLEWNLEVNTTKTELLAISNKTSEWKTAKKLGSLLDDEEDIKRRKQMAAIAFNKMDKIWASNKVSESRRIRIYNAFVLPVLTYNCSTWALTSKLATSIDGFHRRQLRKTIGVRYPETISNVALYDRTKCSAVSSIAKKQRWTLLGHILRRDPDIPAYQAMEAYFKPSTELLVLGRSRTTLPYLINKELNGRAINNGQWGAKHDHAYAKPFTETAIPTSLNSEQDLVDLRQLAQDRDLWRLLVEDICSC